VDRVYGGGEVSKLQKVLVLAAGLVVAAVLFAPPAHGLIQSQRDQIYVAITVNVTPSPIAYQPATVAAAQAAQPIEAHFSLRAKGAAEEVSSTFAQNIGNLVAQSTSQGAVKVQATVSPNPLGTLLTSNSYSVSMSGTAGTTIKQSCVYMVTVDTTITAWTLKEGLSSDFITTTWPGTDAANDSYLQVSTPQPTSTPFVVYPSAWTILSASGLTKTYCVDLTITIPGTVPQGGYSTNAVYTLYY
jgi:hypothetical protein